MKHFYTFLVAILFTSLGFGQTTLYSEDFTGQNGKGATGPGGSSPTIDLTGVSWTIDVTNADLSATSDWFRVENEAFEGQDVDGTQQTNGSGNGPIWISPSIPISGYTDVSISIDAVETGTMENQDFIRASYQIDGGSIIQFAQEIDDFNTATLQVSGLSGSSLVIYVEMDNNAGTESISFDNVLVQGTLASSNPTIGFGTATSTENETNTTFTSSNIPITVTNYDGNQIDIDVSVTGGTAEAGDYAFTSPTSLSFTADGTQNITIDINADADFDDETVELTLTETSSVTGLVISQATHTVTIIDDDTPPLPNIVINEILADSNVIDANGDGTPSATDDEFVELVNNEIFAVDITGYTLSDGVSVRHTFGSVVIPAGGSVVVFGGGTPTGISGISTVASTGGLGLNNGGDTVTLEDTSSNVVATYSYGSEGGNDQSLGRNEDLFGAFVQHTSIQTNPVTASPGLYNTSGLPFSTITWKGFVDNDWANSANWSSGNVPTVLDDVLILQTANHPIISASTSANTVLVNPGAGIETTGSSILTLTTLTLESTSNSYSSLKTTDGNGVVGTVRYNRFVNGIGSGLTEGNDLISPPLSGQNFGDFTAANPNLATAADGITKAFAPFNNDTDTYDNYDTTSNALTSMTGQGAGFRVATTDGSNLLFEGPPITSGASIVSIGTGSFGIWNLIGNRFPAYLHLGDFLDANSAMFDPSFAGIYGYDGAAADGWTIWDSNSDQDLLIAPGQGFFVAVNASGTFSFNANMTRIGNADDFILGRNSSSSNTPIANILLSNEDAFYETNLYFRANNTRGLDPGYDTGAHFGNAKGIFTHLVEDNNGVEFFNQSLPLDDLNGVVVPLGVKSPAQTQITFRLGQNSSLPEPINVYLEDNVTNTFTLLNTTDYVLTPNTSLTGTGRFYIHFTNTTLSAPDNTFETLTIYANQSNRSINISGEVDDNTTASVYDIQGRLITSKALTSSLRLQSIDANAINTGVYIVVIRNGNESKTQKIILK
ncbi:lamin tail domain-containing protein [Winogradskyella aquimaris]|uniref:Lamin tail domain-containing protein n=1 Tax=Winogradskyella aquimaris TaxID=864074 RepID=A0ABU5ELD2_9FLAO|nr:lamin tail domain-containing protein [Winogradskyella aquimaris]MDY2587093.1 lamin tail domain-containing protein [Winogradskyella aquimaris]